MSIKTASSGSELPDDSAQANGLGKADCPQCGGLGYIIPNVPPIHPGFGKAIRCSCRTADLVRENAARLEKMSQIGDLKHLTFRTFSPQGLGIDPVHSANLQSVYDLCVKFAEHPSGWLILKGTYGCGKTHLAAAIGNERLSNGHPVLFVNTPDLLDHIRSTYSPASPVSYDERFDQIKNTPLLILDDFGTQNNTNWTQEKLYQLFNHRYVHKLPTVITINQDLDMVEPRIRSRLEDVELTKVVNILALDFRRSGISSSELSTLDLHFDKHFNNFNFRSELPYDQSENLKIAFNAAKEFAEDPSDWIVFYSVAFGNGKTHLAAAIANEARKRGVSVLFLLVPDLLDYLRAAYSPQSNISYDQRFDEIKKIPLLVLDDLGVESATAWAKEKIYQLFSYRFNARLPTIITTAVHLDEMDARLKVRLLDSTRCSFISIEVPSYRGGVKPKRRQKR